MTDYKGRILQFPSYIEMIGEFAGDYFGYAVDMNCEGNLAVVGALGFSGGGKAYVFENEKILHELEAPDPSAGSSIGWAVAMNATGSIVVVGDRTWSGGTGKGAAHIFTNGVLSHSMSSNLTASGVNYGVAVAINASGALVAVGNTGATGDNTHPCEVYVYSNGALLTTLQAYDGAFQISRFGGAIAFSDSGGGGILVVGASGWDSNYGKVYVYNNLVLAYSLEGLVANESLGASVAISGDGAVLVAGAWTYTNAAVNQGRAYVYLNGTLLYTLEAPHPTYDMRFGHSVSISSDGKTVLVGTMDPYGKVYVFKEGVLIQEVVAVDTQAANFGADIAVNCEGTSMIVGASGWDGTNLDGTGGVLIDRGRAYVLPVPVNMSITFEEMHARILEYSIPDTGSVVRFLKIFTKVGDTWVLTRDEADLVPDIPEDTQQSWSLGHVHTSSSEGVVLVGHIVTGDPRHNFTRPEAPTPTPAHIASHYVTSTAEGIEVGMALDLENLESWVYWVSEEYNADTVIAGRTSYDFINE